MKIVLYSNSQGTNLDLPEKCLPYPEIMRARMPRHVEFVSNTVSGLHIRTVAQDLDSLLAIRPDVAMFQIGIIECARRILSRFEKHVLYGIPLTRPLTHCLRKNRTATIRFRDLMRITTREVRPKEFEELVCSVKSRLEEKGVKVILFCIPLYPPAYEDELYGLNEDIAMYNEILTRCGGVQIFDDSENLEAFYTKGTVHFTCQGHDEVANRMLCVVSRETGMELG